jgi:hypothetical protein
MMNWKQYERKVFVAYFNGLILRSFGRTGEKQGKTSVNTLANPTKIKIVHLHGSRRKHYLPSRLEIWCLKILTKK